MDSLQKRCTADVILYFCSFCDFEGGEDCCRCLIDSCFVFPMDLVGGTTKHPAQPTPGHFNPPVFFFRFSPLFFQSIDVLVLRELVSEAKGTFRRPNNMLKK